MRISLLILGFKGLSDVQGKYLYLPTMPEIAILKSLDRICKSYFLYTSPCELDRDVHICEYIILGETRKHPARL